MPERVPPAVALRSTPAHHTWSLLRNLGGSVLTVNYQDARHQGFCDFV